MFFFFFFLSWGQLDFLGRKRKTAATFYHLKPEKRKHSHTTISNKMGGGKKNKVNGTGKVLAKSKLKMKKGNLGKSRIRLQTYRDT